MALVMAALFTGSGNASEVYIEQAGDTGVFNITQTSGSNRVGTQGTPSNFSGNNILVDIVQTGTLNAADLQVLTATDTVIDYSATGDSNTLLVEIGNSGNSLTVVKTGDSNRVTMCGTNDGGGTPAGANASCLTDVGVVDTVNVANITGSRNSVNFALASPNANNTVNIGQTAISNDNVVNITQSGAGTHITNVGINGDANKVNITQQN